MTAAAAKALGQYELWFVAGSQEMYGEQVLAAVAADAREIAGALDGADAVPVRVVLRETATTPEAIRRLCRAVGAIGALA